MAERASLRNEGGRPAGENDPFAELARIIGFDPRVRVGGASPASAPQDAPDDEARAAANGSSATSPSSSPPPAELVSEPEIVSDEAGEWDEAFSDLAFWDDDRTAAGMGAPAAGDASPTNSTGSSPADAGDGRAARGDSAPRLGGSKQAVGLEDAGLQRAQPPAAELGTERDADGSGLDLELDDVLAASIERELEETWLGGDTLMPEEGARSDSASVQAETPLGQIQDVSVAAAPTAPRPDVSLAPGAAADRGAFTDFESELVAHLSASGPEAQIRPRTGLATSAQAASAVGPAAADAKDLPAAVLPTVSAKRNTSSPGNEPAQAVDGDPARPFMGKEFTTDGPSAARSVAESRRKPVVAAPPVPAREFDDDPFAALAAMAARYRAAQFNPVTTPSKAAAPPPPPQPLIEEKAEVEDMKRYPSARTQAPEIETVDVPEYTVALTADVDVPDTPFDEPPAAHDRFGDVDAEFADLLQEMGGEPGSRNEGAYAQKQASAYHQLPDARYGATSRAAYRSDYAPRSYSPESPAAAAPVYGHQTEDHQDWPAGNYGDQYSEAYDETVYPEAFPEDDEAAPQKQPRKRGRWLAALFGSVAIFGAAGAFALKYTGAADLGGPLLVKADATPIKIRPENPGGIAVPNQENQVYERVAGLNNIMPTQPKLLSNDEQPVSLEDEADDAGLPGLDLSSEDEEAPATKSDNRVSAAEEQPRQPAKDPIMVTPRKVRTMVVKADGTIVAQEPATPAVQSLVAEASSAIETVKKGSVAAAVDAADATASVKPDGEGDGSASPISARSDDLPASQPAVIEASAIPAAWSMQIASQPSEDSARSSYANLAKRYSAVLAGRDVSIVRAEVSGKGTFWRVRVAANTRSDAVNLCQSYKAAGGTCFVSK